MCASQTLIEIELQTISLSVANTLKLIVLRTFL